MAYERSRKQRVPNRKRVSSQNLELFPPKITFEEFVNKWKSSTLSERAGSHSQFMDLCYVLQQETPTDVDTDGSTYSFEKQVEKISGGDGFADVWKERFFAWEYKRKGRSLTEAYQQLLKYREALNNPPLLIVCDFNRFEVHTNWTNTSPEVYKFDLQDILLNRVTEHCRLSPREVLRAVFTEPEILKPGDTSSQVTKKAAEAFSKLAESLRDRGVPPEDVGHYVMRLLFCLFAEDIHLLKDRPFRTSVENNCRKPVVFVAKLRDLFEKMSKGGSFGTHDIPYFDGGLFMDDKVHELTVDDMEILRRAGKLNWAAIEPAIFGTLFERILDPKKRKLGIGARYTSSEDIELIVEPVLMRPLRAEWVTVQQSVSELIGIALQKKADKSKSLMRAAEEGLREFIDKISTVRVLDPACGSGNFLYVALKRLLDLEKEVSVFAWSHGLSGFFTRCHPSQLLGIENNVYAHKVASVAVWIGYLQWHQQNGMPIRDNPVMQPLENIQLRNAVLAYDSDGHAVQARWPEAFAVIGNPPYVGGNRIRQELGNENIEALFSAYRGKVPASSDYVCYWFECARAGLESKCIKRIGLLATQAIRGGVNRQVLERVKQTGDIFMAWSDREWPLDGATVHVSFVGFDDGSEREKTLDGRIVSQINSDLTSSVDLTKAVPLAENTGLWAYGSQQKGSFEINEEQARQFLRSPNPLGRNNRDVVKRSINGKQLLQDTGKSWVVDFDANMSKEDAALYEAPFQHVKKIVYPERKDRNEVRQRTHWWLHARPSPKYRRLMKAQKRYIATPVVSKHRVFVWLDNQALVDHAIVAFGREDDYFWGVLQAKPHELWSRRKGTQVRDASSGFRYTPSTTFETYPFPWVPGQEPKDESNLVKISEAAKRLNEKRESWLNPHPAQTGVRRTLTRLYNEDPQWLIDAHAELDRAVLAAYGWSVDLSDEEILSALLRLNLKRAVEVPKILYQDTALASKKAPASVPGTTEKKRVPSS
jgi:hypothetical protein